MASTPSGMAFRRLVSFGEETTYGQAPADLSRWIGGVSNFNGGVELAEESVATLNNQRTKTPVVHGIDAGPSLEYYVQTAQFFKYALGSVVDSGTAPPYTHTIDISSDYTLPSVSLLEHRIGQASHGYLYTGCRVESLEVSWEEDGLLTASVRFIAQKASKTTTLPAVSPDTRDYFKASQKQVTINGQPYGYVVGGSISITNNHVKLPRQGDYIGEPIADRVDVEASLELYYMDDTIYDLMLNKTSFNITVRFERSTSDYIEFQLNNCYASVEAGLPAEGELMQTLNVRPESITIVASDDIAAY